MQVELIDSHPTFLPSGFNDSFVGHGSDPVLEDMLSERVLPAGKHSDCLEERVMERHGSLVPTQ